MIGSAVHVAAEVDRSGWDCGAALERVIEQAVDARAGLEGVGAALAATYLDGAVVALRFALAALLKGARDSAAVPADGLPRLLLDGFPTDVRLVAGPDGTCRRGRLVRSGGDAVYVPGSAGGFAGGEHAAVDLASDLLLSDPACDMATDPWAAALLLDALCCRDWTHCETGLPWSIGRSGARSVVTAMRGGLAVRSVQSGLRGRWVDDEVLACIEALGWRRRFSVLGAPRIAS